MMEATMTDPARVRGTVVQKSDDRMVLALPGLNYQLHLTLGAPLAVEVGTLVTGRIFGRAKRVDVIGAGGRYIEPLYGRPRRLQGTVRAIDAATNSLVVHCGAAFTCELTMNQQASSFEVGQLVSFDVERGARFEPV